MKATNKESNVQISKFSGTVLSQSQTLVLQPNFETAYQHAHKYIFSQMGENILTLKSMIYLSSV